MTEVSLFDCEDYKVYLQQRIAQMPAKGRGFRSQLAQMLRCQTSYISNVLNGSSHFTLEHFLILSRMLKHNDEESRFFLLLLQRDRAGTLELKKYFAIQITEMQSKRLLLHERIKAEPKMKLEQQAEYFSEWYYVTLHLLCGTAKFGTLAKLANRLQLPIEVVQKVLEFLEKNKLVKRFKNFYQLTETRIHLGADAPLVTKQHHLNWRLRALQTLSRASFEGDLHYTSVVTISIEDREKIKEILIRAIERYNDVVAQSPEEDAYCLNLDFYRV